MQLACTTTVLLALLMASATVLGQKSELVPKAAAAWPVGLEGLVTYKYQLVGDGHIAGTYSGENAKSFTHKDLE